MKRIFSFVLLTFFFSSVINLTFAQQWREYLTKKTDRNYTLFDYQEAFKAYCDNYKLTNRDDFKDPENLQFEIPGYSQFKRWEWYWEPRVDQKTGEFPKKSAWEVWQNYKTKNNIKSTGGTWTSRGAANLDAYDSGAMQESGTGRLNCALFDPTNNNHFWVGAPAGGLWESTDNGSTWTCLTDDNPVLGVSDIAIPPDYNITTNPTIFIASGDRDAGDDPSIGVLKTTNGGTTWTQTGLDFHDKSGVRIGRLIINPDDKNIMWAATSLGMYRSSDAGTNWGFVQGGNFIDMELIPGSTGTGNGTLIATTYGWSPKVYKTTDGGLTWTNTWTSPTADEFRCDVAVTPASSTTVYITTADGTNNMAFHGLYKSSDTGSSFSQIYAGTTNNLYGWYANNNMSAGGQGWYDATLAVSNTNANVVYIGGVNGFISTNGGSSFSVCNGWTSSVGADVVHADHHNAYFRLSDNRLYDCNDGGFYYSDNVTSGSSSNWTSKTNGIVTGQIYDIGVAQTVANEVVAGYQDNGTKLLEESTSSYNWYIVKAGDGMCCAIDPTTQNTQWGSYAEMQISRTTNEWGSSSSIRSGGNADWAGPIEADPRLANTIYIGTAYVERYVGTSRTTLSASLDANYLKALDVYNDGSNLVIWAASLAGCWKSNTSGGSYTAVSGLPGDAVTDMAIDEDNYNHVYVCFGGYDNNNVYETTNGGGSWTDISAGLPAVPCGAIVINEQNTSKHEVYVGTDAGTYVKLGNAPWQLFNDGMPYVSITDLEIYYNATPANTRIYASTYGRGTWSTDCYDPPTLDAAISYISVPATEYCSLGNITPTVELGNIGTTTLTSATISYTIDGGAPVTQNWTGSLTQGATTNIIFPSIPLTYGAHDFVTTVSNPNGGTDSNSSNDSRSKTFSVWNNDVPYTQAFDNFTPAIGYSGDAVILEECWTNETGESSLDWSVTQGETPSGSTGPSGDHTSGNGRYLYTEVSGISSATSVQLLSPVFDLTNYTNNQISFWYQLNGANCGSLQIDLYYVGTWHNGISASWNGTTATSVSGNKGQTWFQVTADISAADSDANTQIRISSTTGTAYDGDIAIDDFNISGTSACTQPATQATNLSFSSVTNNSITASWTSGSGDAEIVVVREGSAVNQDPSSGTTYTANAAFGSGSQIGTGNYVVYDGTAGTVTVTSLTSGLTYYFAVYTYNAADHCYNITELTGNTTTLGPPTVTTTAVSGITGNSANSGGNVTSDNGSAVTARGVCWNTTGTPTTSDNTTSDGTGTGVFTSSMTGLSASTTYYVRAYATNAYGTSYGNQETFTTSCGTISSYPFTEGFESGTFPPDCWDSYRGTNGIGTSQDWTTSTPANSGANAAYVRYENVSGGNAEDWLVTPQLQLGTSSQMTFYERESYTTDYNTNYYIKVSTTSQTDQNSFSDLVSYGESGSTSYTQRTVDLSSYDNQTIYIAFVMEQDDGDDWYIDDINITSVPGATAISWNGSVSSNWQTSGNWDGGSIPLASNDVTIPNGMPNYPVINNGIGTVAVCNDITIENSASVTIDPNGYMTVSGSITNNAGNSGLVINSDATGTGSLIHNTSGGVDATVNNYLAAPVRQWHMVGSPITTAPVSVFPVTSNLYYYDESIDDYWTGTTSYDSPVNGWTAFNSGNMALNTGYLFNYYVTTLNYTGQLNDNTTTGSISIAYNDHGGTAPNGKDYNDFDGWNFISNPYTSAIDWDNTSINHAAANLDDAVYYYDGANSQYSSWIAGAGTNGGTQFIPAMQGFFVKANASGTLNIPAGALVHNAQSFWKSSKDTPENFLKLQISGNGYTDETIIRFNENATEEHDSNFDAYKLFSHETDMIQIYSVTNNLTELSINTLPEITSNVNVPLILINSPETYNINVSEFNFYNTDVSLKDNLTNKLYNLSNNIILNFAKDESDNNNRFELIFNKNSSNIYVDNEFGFNIYPNPNNGIFYLSFNKVIDFYKVEISDITGKTIYRNTFKNSIKSEIDLNNQSKGIYFIKIRMFDNSIINKKLIIE